MDLVRSNAAHSKSAPIKISPAMRYTPRILLKPILGSLLIVLLFSGCASAPSIDADRAAVTRIKRIAVLAISEPTNVQVANIGGAAMGFGLVGGLIQGGVNASHSKQFVELLKTRKHSFAQPLEESLSQVLHDEGYEVTVVRDQKPTLSADGKSDDYSGVHVDADAILAVWFGVTGYMSAPNSLHYEPWVLIKARLLDAATKKDVYYKTFTVGYRMKIENVVSLPADPKYRYSSFDDLMARADDAAAGLKNCDDTVASRIALDLRPN